MHKQVTLNPGQSQEVSFKVAPSAEGSYGVQINGLVGEFSATTAAIFDPWVYDTNGDCYIDINEQLKATQDYFDLKITIDRLNQVKYLFENNIKNPACLVGTYYSPFGGRRTPICTELTIPNVEPFVAYFTSHPGGDYIMEGHGAFRVAFGPLIGTSEIPPEIEERLNDAYPSAWDIGTVGIRPGTDWSIHRSGDWLYVAARASINCPPYWDSKEELAQVIAGLRGYDWALPLYGTAPSGLAGYDVIRGIAGWERPVNWDKSGGYGILYTDWIYCPYCGGATGHTTREYSYSGAQYLVIARKLLEHIEQEHPEHPLTEPA